MCFLLNTGVVPLEDSGMSVVPVSGLSCRGGSSLMCCEPFCHLSGRQGQRP